MRALVLSLVLGVAALLLTAATPTTARAEPLRAIYADSAQVVPAQWRGWRGGTYYRYWRGGTRYYGPRYYGYYGYYGAYPGYYGGYYPSYSYYPGYYGYSPGYTGYNPGYYGYYNPGYSYYYYYWRR